MRQVSFIGHIGHNLKLLQLSAQTNHVFIEDIFRVLGMKYRADLNPSLEIEI